MNDAATERDAATGRTERHAKRVSVIIPVLDAASTLGRQLDLVRAEEPGVAVEIIVADNGSRDASRAVAARHLAGTASHAVIDASDRRGPAHARNAGAAVAQGELLCFCDADDEIEPGWLSALLRAATHHDFVAGRLDVDALNYERARRARPRPIPAGTDAPPFAPSGNFAVWADVFASVGGFDETLLADEDADLSRRLLARGTSLGWAPDAVVRYRFRITTGAIARQSCRAAWYATRGGRPRRGGLGREIAWVLTRAPLALAPARRGLWAHHAGSVTGQVAARTADLVRPTASPSGAEVPHGPR